MHKTPTLLVTLGDPLSVNIEAMQQLLAKFPENIRTVFIGSWVQWQRQCSLASKPLFRAVNSWDDIDSGLNFWDVDPQGGDIHPAQLSELQRGQIAVKSLELVRTYPSLDGAAVLTCPIDKFSCQKAGFPFPGQTEFFESLADKEGIMILAGPKLKVGLATNHLALQDVPKALSAELIQKKFGLMAQTIREIYKRDKVTLAVTGLNPHCGDQGMFGREDLDIIKPAMDNLSSKSHDIGVGPVPADTAFFQAYSGTYDGVLAMYHDQGLGPLKTVHFYDAVNITGGLPFLRVSPDHGPAADKFAKNEANIQSFTAALDHCLGYLEHD